MEASERETVSSLELVVFFIIFGENEQSTKT